MGGGKGDSEGRKTFVNNTKSQTIPLMHQCPNELVYDYILYTFFLVGFLITWINVHLSLFGKLISIVYC